MRTPTAVSRSCRRLLLILAALSLVPARHGASAEARLIVVVPDALRPSLDGWLEHKRSKLAVEVASLETILRESPGVDDPERLKRFLHAARRQSAGKQDPPAAAAAADPYVLLVGDADVLPVRYMVLDRVTPAAQDYAFYPSDLYYADVAKPDGSFEDWNARKDGFHAGYFGEVRGEKNKEGPINFDGIDYLPELAVGRWPASTPEEVATIAAKSLAYERGLLDGKKPGARRAAFVAVGGWVDSRGLFDRLADSLPAGWTAEKRYFGGGRRGPRAAGPGPSADEVVKILSEGAGLVCHAGHGQDDRWEQSLGIADLPRVSNDDRLPIVISAGCSTARFATLPPYEPYLDVSGAEHVGTDRGEVFDAPPPPPSPWPRGRYNLTGLGEALLRRGPGGAVAYIGCNTGSQPCGLTLVEGFVLAWKEPGVERLGDAWRRAIRHYHEKERLSELAPTESWYPASIYFQGMKFLVFGDPSLPLPRPGP